MEEYKEVNKLKEECSAKIERLFKMDREVGLQKMTNSNWSLECWRGELMNYKKGIHRCN